MSRPRLLDLFCGAGGAAMGYHRAGFDVVGVDKDPQPAYPFEFRQFDVMDPKFVWGGFDAVHASPPCQRYSRASKRWNGRSDSHPDLVGPVRTMLESSHLPYVIENVPGAPMEDFIVLCGSMFPPLGVIRHRQFEANFRLLCIPKCDHAAMPLRYDIYDHGKWYKSRVAHVYGNGGGKSKGLWHEAMGMDWGTLHGVSQAIPPAYTEFIGSQLRTEVLRRYRERVADSDI